MADQPRLEDWQQMLEKTKKEVREIRAAEAKMKCNMMREERKERVVLNKAASMEIMQWRQEQDMLSKEQAAMVADARKKQELEDSREFQDFKRLRKQLPIQEERCLAEVQYQEDTEQSRWNVELKRAAEEEKRNMVVAHFEKYDHIRALRAETAAQTRAIEDDERVHEKQLSMDFRLKELMATKNKMLQSMEYTRGRHGAPLSLARPLFPEAKLPTHEITK